MGATEAADALATLAGVFLLINFLLFQAEVPRVQISGLLVGLIVTWAGWHNVKRNMAGKGGLEQVNHAAIIMGMWMAFLTLFWKTSAHTEFVAVIGGLIMTITSAYASYRRQNPESIGILKGPFQ